MKKVLIIFGLFVVISLSACRKEAGLTLSDRNKEFSMFIGDEKTLRPFVNAGFTLEWLSSDQSLLEIEVFEDSLSAVLIAKAVGAVEVKISVKGLSDCEIVNITIVDSLPTAVVISGNDSVEVGSSIPLTGFVLPAAANQSLTWSSEDEEVAIVNQFGLVTGLSEGVSVIRANSILAKVFKVYLVEVVPATAKSVNLSGPQIIEVDSFVAYSVSISPSEASQEVIWSVDNPLLATISEDGLLQSLAAGVVKIKASAKENINIAAELEVEIIIPHPETIIINGVSELEVGETKMFSASISPVTAMQSVLWSSEDESILRVNESGKIEALQIGKTNIVAKSIIDNSIVAKKQVLVIASIPLINFELNGGEWAIYDLDPFLEGEAKSTPLGSYNPTGGAYLSDYPENIFIQVSTNTYIPNVWVNRLVVVKDENGLYKITAFIPAGQEVPEGVDLLKIDYLIYAHSGYKVGYDFLKLCAVGEVVTVVGTDLSKLDRGIIKANLKVYSSDSLQLLSKIKLDYDEVLPQPSKDGFTFKGWYLNSDFSGEAITSVLASFGGEVNLYAQWKAIE